MNNKREPLLIVVSAPSGSGKTTIVRRLVEMIPEMKRSVSYATRQIRDGEKDKDDYIFIKKEEFFEKRRNGEFLESEENFGNYYATSRKKIEEILEQGNDVILSLDIKGARTVRRLFPSSISIFIMPPSVKELETRLKKRNTDHEEQVSLRLKEAEAEISAADEFDYLVVNEDLQKAVEEIMVIVKKERATRRRKGPDKNEKNFTR
ncbi:MAG: guanylate kinase [Candidatus Omnitrophota bacterium]